MQLTLIDSSGSGRRATDVVATNQDGRVVISVDDLERATGLRRKPEGLCIDDACFPVRTPIDFDAGGEPGVDLAGVAEVLHRPLVLDSDAGVAALGASAEQRSIELTSGTAPSFTLPDLDGRLHTLSDFRGRKVVLYAYASW